VVQHQHPHGAAPQQAGETLGDRAADRPPEQEGRRQAGQDPPHEGAVDEAHDGVGEQVRRVARLQPALRMDEQPADVRVPEAAQRALQAVPVVHVRGVRVTRLVRERVVLAVVGDPGDHRALDRGAAERGEDRAHGLARLERAVREEPVEADGDPQAGGHVHDREHDQVTPAEQRGPDLPRHHAEGEDRKDGHGAGEETVEVLVRDGLDVVALSRGCCHRPGVSHVTARSRHEVRSRSHAERDVFRSERRVGVSLRLAAGSRIVGAAVTIPSP
jgi:hypothetical protein